MVLSRYERIESQMEGNKDSRSRLTLPLRARLSSEKGRLTHWDHTPSPVDEATTTQHVPMINDFNSTYSPLQEVSSLPSPSMPYSAPITFTQTNSPYQHHGYANSPASGSSYSGSPMESPQQMYHTNEDYLRYGLTQALNARHQQEYAYYYRDYGMKRRKRDEELTHEEYEKRRLRRERNKEAALRCRTRRRERIDALEQETAEIEHDNNKVENEITKLKQQVSKMQALLKDHKCDKVLPNEPQMKTEPF